MNIIFFCILSGTVWYKLHPILGFFPSCILLGMSIHNELEQAQKKNKCKKDAYLKLVTNSEAESQYMY